MRRQPALRTAFATLAVAFFATPIILAALGVSAERFENRRLADAPKPSQGWNAFQQTGQFLTDRMPLRAQAVRANTRIWQDVFDTDPRLTAAGELADDQALPFAGEANEVRNGRRDPRLARRGDRAGQAEVDGAQSLIVTGRDGWLYMNAELSAACLPPRAKRAALARWRSFVATVAGDSRRAFMLIAPDKASVYPEHLPAAYPNDSCALDGKDELWRLVERRERAGSPIRGLRADLLRRKVAEGDDLYQRKDQHWSTAGALSLVAAALKAVGGRVRMQPSEIVNRRTVAYTGDLTTLVGRPETDERVEVDIRREAGAPRVPGRTLLIGDSFGYRWVRLFRPYFGDVRQVRWYDSGYRIAKAVERSDIVVIEAVENSLLGLTASSAVVAEARRNLRAMKG
jgi:alginate O-acetyltransferase complex protein AlgJ